MLQHVTSQIAAVVAQQQAFMIHLLGGLGQKA